MQSIKKVVDENPKTGMFVLGVVCALLLVLMLSYVMKSESLKNAARAPPEAAFLFGGAGPAEHAFGTDPQQASKDPRFHAEHMDQPDHVNVAVPAPSAVPPTAQMTKTDNSKHADDNDSKATSHMLTRGSVDRSVHDSSRNRYLGLSALGAADYEGYVYKGNVLSDEQGELTATVYGISESPWN